MPSAVMRVLLVVLVFGGGASLAPAQAVEPLSKAEPLSKTEMEDRLIGSTLIFTDGRQVSLSKDGIYSVRKRGQMAAAARYTLASGNILQVHWSPRNEQRDLFYKDNGKYFVIDRWGRRSDIATVQMSKAPESVGEATETTGSLSSGVTPLEMNVRVELDLTPEMIDAGVRVLTSRRMADDGLAARSAVERIFREMIAARQRKTAR